VTTIDSSGDLSRQLHSPKVATIATRVYEVVT
jgi:hypothetical protein